MVAPAGYGGPVPRRLSDPAVLAEQLAHLDDEHVAPLTALVARLREQHAPRPVPSPAPLGAGTGTRVLALLRAPWPASSATGLLSLEDDDPAAERLHGLVTAAGVDPALVLPWGAAPYPVPGEEPLSTPDVKAGRAALEGLVPLLPRLRSVVLHGVSRDQFMARHKANHAQVAYAPDAQTADRALLAKAALFDRLGLRVHLCGDVDLLAAPAQRRASATEA